MTLDVGRNLLWYPFDKGRKLLVTELKFDQYEIPAKMSRSQVLLQVSQTAVDTDGVIDISIDFEGYYKREFTDEGGKMDDIDSLVEHCLQWFGERGAEIVD